MHIKPMINLLQQEFQVKQFNLLVQSPFPGALSTTLVPGRLEEQRWPYRGIGNHGAPDETGGSLEMVSSQEYRNEWRKVRTGPT